GNQINPLRTDITRTVRNFRYDFPYETNVVYNPNIMTALLTATPTPNEGVDLAEYLNGHATAGDAPASGTAVASMDDIFPALRRNWYEDTPKGTFPVTGTGGNNLTFANTVSLLPGQTTVVNTDGTADVNIATTLTAGVINSLTFNGASATLESVALPTLTLNGTAVLDILGTTFGAGTTIGVANLRDVQANHFANGITFTGNTNVSIDPAQDSFTIGNTVTFSGGATQRITLEKTTGDPITITVPASQNVSDPDTSVVRGFQAGTGVTLENAPEAPVENRIVVPTPAAGRYAIRQTVGDVNTEIVPPADFSAGDTITHTINDTVFTNPADTVQVYVKYDSTIGVGGTVYSESEQVFIFNSDGSDINYIPQIVAPVLVDTATPLVGHNIAARADGDNVIVSIANTLNNNRLELDANETLGALISAANTNAYWDAWYANRVMSATPLFDYVQGFRTSVDARFVTLASGNRIGADGFVQHQIANTVRNAASVGDTLIEAGTGIPELTVQLSDLAIVDPGLIASAVDASNTASSVEDIVNYEGYRSQNPLLNGPNGGAINNATDYRNNIRRT
ncbi:MAG: hypothetical protein OXE50_14965, partial [Chloroflexi bacterium]|nr:hypothetical protein [Chloroflexota bacterium]